ncbi:MAG: cytochrome-c peroxidase [Zoogloeaceae bacterium]|jgi:cytochrome c peroxidase|nr:cytochrome-c peroxidase [Zoogloeaceae bacterium]
MTSREFARAHSLALLAGAILMAAVVGAVIWLPNASRATAETKERGTPSMTQRILARPDEPLLPIQPNVNLDAGKVELGRALFHDPRLSRDNSISCAFCHDLARGGTDRLPKSVGVGGQLGTINSPTVYNAALNFRQFWDGRAATLEEQVTGPIHNPVEMASSWQEVIAKLTADPETSNKFIKLYGGPPSAESIQDAIAEFERSLITPSRMDRWLKGDDRALTPQELAGYQLFKRYGCVACHQGANVGGNMYQRFGIMKDYFEGRTRVDPADLGRFNVTSREEDKYVFKVPSLRNIAATAPYFHDASVNSLHEAVSRMGEFQLGVELPPEDIQSIVLFLYTLNGEQLQ